MTPEEKWKLIIETADEHFGRGAWFVETGTDTGATAAKMADARMYDSALGYVARFGRVITIEIDDARYANAVALFFGERDVLPIHGDSDKVLGRLCPNLAGPAVWWLDAHRNGDAGGPVVCPLIAELIHILHHRPAGHVILIDDVDLLGTPDWPAVDDIIRVVHSYAPGKYRVDVHGTVMVLTPSSAGTGWQAASEGRSGRRRKSD